MSRDGRKTKSRNRSHPERIKGTGREERRDPSIGNCRREFRKLNINFVKIFYKGCEAIREHLKMIRIRRIETEYAVFGCGG